MRLSEAQKQELLQYPVEDLARIAARSVWCKKARKDQLTPRGDWTTWLIITGRGWGKTRTGAEWLWWEASKEPGSINGVIAPTYDMLNSICVNGESGLMAVIPEQLITDYNKSTQTIKLWNGAEIQGLSAQEPDRLRGRQFHRIWADEAASWDRLVESMDNLNFCLRLGKHPRKLVTTTPKPLKAVKDLMNGEKTHLTSGSTYDNKANLPASFFSDISRYAGTKLGDQEIYGKLIDWSESGIFRRDWFKIWPNRKPDGSKNPFPKLAFILQSYDTAFKAKQNADYSACTTWGVFRPYEDRAEFGLMLLDCWHERLDYPDLRKKMQEEYKAVFTDEERHVDLVLIEDKASGQALIPDLQRAGVPVEAYTLPPDADKIQRAHAVSHLAKRYLWIPETTREGREWKGSKDLNLEKPTFTRPWVEPFLEEVCAFGPETFREMERMRRNATMVEQVTSHDDWVDTLSQALAWLRDSQWLRWEEDTKDEPEPEEQSKKRGTYG